MFLDRIFFLFIEYIFDVFKVIVNVGYLLLLVLGGLVWEFFCFVWKIIKIKINFNLGIVVVYFIV